MNNTIGLIGVGSLGSLLATKLQSHVETMFVIDPDTVEERNLRNSIYITKDIKQPKVLALKDKITECNVIPIQADIRNVDLTNVKQLFDCRDVVNRNLDSDVKFLVTGKNLRVDCKEPVYEDDQPGNYIIELEKNEISTAAGIAKDALMSDSINYLRDNKTSFNLPLSTRNVTDEMDFLIRQKETPLPYRDISENIFNDIKGVGKNGRIRTKLCKLDNHMGIETFDLGKMYYPDVIDLLNDKVMRNHGTYFINTQKGCIEICDPLIEGGA